MLSRRGNSPCASLSLKAAVASSPLAPSVSSSQPRPQSPKYRHHQPASLSRQTFLLRFPLLQAHLRARTKSSNVNAFLPMYRSLWEIIPAVRRRSRGLHGRLLRNLRSSLKKLSPSTSWTHRPRPPWGANNNRTVHQQPLLLIAVAQQQLISTS